MKNISTESKVFLLILVVLMLGLTMINFIYIQSIRMQIEDGLRQQIINYQILLKHNIPFEYPRYLKITKSEMNNSYYILFEIDNPNYFYVDSRYFKEMIKDKLFLMVYWDFIIMLVISLLYYFTVHKMILREKRLRLNFEAILLVFSHKLRNYLSTQKINLELLNANNLSIISRLEQSYNSLNNDISAMEKYIRNISIESEKFDEIRIGDFINNKIGFGEWFKLKVIGRNFSLKLNIYDFESIIFLLFDNVKKYSKKYIYIRYGIYKNKKYFVILNDICENCDAGLGIGLSLAEILCKKNGISIKWKKNRYFVVLMVFDNL